MDSRTRIAGIIQAAAIEWAGKPGWAEHCADALLTAEPAPHTPSRAELCIKFCEGFDDETLEKGPSLSELASAYPSDPEPCEDAREMVKKIISIAIPNRVSLLQRKDIDAAEKELSAYASQVADKRAEELRAQVETLRMACEKMRNSLYFERNTEESKLAIIEALAATEPKT